MYRGSCEARQLLPLSLTFHVNEDGRVLHRLVYRCWCGHRDVEVVPGPAAGRIYSTPIGEPSVGRVRKLLARLARVLADVRELHQRPCVT